MTMQAWTLGAFRNDPALFIAAREADFDLLALFGEFGADPAQAKNKDGATLLMAALGYAPHALGGGVPTPPREINSASELANAVIALGTDVNDAKNDGMTALHVAAEKGLDEHVRFLVEHGARLDIKDNSNRLPIHVAEAIKPVRTGPPPPMPPPDPVPHETTIELLRELMAAAGVEEEEYVAPPPPAEDESEASEEVTSVDDSSADDAPADADATASAGSEGTAPEVFAAAASGESE
jgi:hypothetical protein